VAYYYRGKIYAEGGGPNSGGSPNYEQALADYEHTGYQNEVCLQLLASLYAQNGDFDNAVRWQEKALQLPIFEEQLANKRLDNYRKKSRTSGGFIRVR
jgi:hypothetical protein